MATQMTKSQPAETELPKKGVKDVFESLATIGYKELKKTGVLLVPGADGRDPVDLPAPDSDPACDAREPDFRVLRRQGGPHPAPAGEAAEEREERQPRKTVAQPAQGRFDAKDHAREPSIPAAALYREATWSSGLLRTAGNFSADAGGS